MIILNKQFFIVSILHPYLASPVACSNEESFIRGRPIESHIGWLEGTDWKPWLPLPGSCGKHYKTYRTIKICTEVCDISYNMDCTCTNL